MVVHNPWHVRWPAWVILAAMVAAVGASHPSEPPEPLDPFRPLIQATSLANRNVAPRLSGGFPWAPLQPTQRGERNDASDHRPSLLVAAGEVARQSGDGRSPEGRHAMALCDLLLGDAQKAADKIRALTRELPGAATWNDLAAAEYVAATRNDDPSSLARALTAADAALEAAPNFPEARFNRALILETLGLRDQARDDWEIYLRLDGGSGWAVEARRHVLALPPEEPFADHLAKRYTQLLADASEARALARAYPQESRVAGEEDILARWGEATLRGDDAQAVKHLALARVIGAELVRSGGDEMLAVLVESIERAIPAQRTSLAHAHILFREGRQRYYKRELKAAERALVASAAEFARANGPGELMARGFAANTIYEESRVSEAETILKSVLAAAGDRYPSVRAHVQWELGGVALVGGRWGTCLEAFGGSLSIFERLGERNYAALVRGHIAGVYARLGKPEQAWRYRIGALQELGRTPSFRLHQALDAVTQAALADRDWPLAVSFLGLDIELAERMGNPQVTIESHLSRAELKIRQHQSVVAEQDLREARRVIEGLQEPAYQREYEANAKAVEAELTTSPTTAVALLSEAIDFHGTVGRRMYLPWLLMLRGRADRAIGDDERAARDFEAGIAELENGRSSLAGGEDRWGIFHAADDLFAGAIALALDQGDPQRAFAYAEQERARGLLDVLGASWRPVTPSDLPEGTVVVEYAANEKALIIFTLSAHGVHALRQDVPRETLRREITSLGNALASLNGRTIHESGRALYRHLIEPVERDLAGAKRIAFVPDPRLDSPSFAALRDSAGRFLVENYVLTVEPSAAVFTRLHKPSTKMTDRQVLIVTGSDEVGALTFANGEARAVAAQYGHVSRLAREGATTAAFEREAKTADVIHFVGHGVASTGARESGYLVVGGDNGDEGRLDVKRIAALRLSHTSLVVLAACATAAGETRSTEGTISVARAFLAAGVPSVVATLRPIFDEDAARFFPRFHRYVANGLSPAEALRQTQLEWIGKGDGATAMWTAVQVIGE